jgi:putative transcriptional regulator
MAIKNHFMRLWNRKEAREERRITLTEISEQTGVGWGTVNRWKREEVNRYDADILSAFCAYFECGIGDLLEYTPDEEAGIEASEETQ